MKKHHLTEDALAFVAKQGLLSFSESLALKQTSRYLKHETNKSLLIQLRSQAMTLGKSVNRILHRDEAPEKLISPSNVTQLSKVLCDFFDAFTLLPRNLKIEFFELLSENRFAQILNEEEVSKKQTLYLAQMAKVVKESVYELFSKQRIELVQGWLSTPLHMRAAVYQLCSENQTLTSQLINSLGLGRLPNSAELEEVNWGIFLAKKCEYTFSDIDSKTILRFVKLNPFFKKITIRETDLSTADFRSLKNSNQIIDARKTRWELSENGRLSLYFMGVPLGFGLALLILMPLAGIGAIGAIFLVIIVVFVSVGIGVGSIFATERLYCHLTRYHNPC